MISIIGYVAHTTKDKINKNSTRKSKRCLSTYLKNKNIQFIIILSLIAGFVLCHAYGNIR